ncbi:hypothetical protein [Nostocoides australiense]|uniref:Uncharacterized protein n=1 Tax=Nostocoides australiense Ben110 TaxID=1193182 RepID=W6K0X0_9MICO|nr:hypothetical protein [Tetrasphaera australiensis]CCH75533.1 exported hypothetical protein [Tetrasphaera australiensis Ben110]HPF82374.1 hypothetical protein [Tetrasphaera australiensis]HRW02560.1 hypothetical protein [Tetrasphaera sp.]
MFRKLGYAALAAGSVAGLATAAPAQATTSAPAGNYCVGDIKGGLIGCYDTEREADRVMANKRWIPLVIFFDNTGYSGKRLTLGHARPCTATLSDVNYALPDLRVYRWNNRAGSFVTRNRCDLKGYDGFNYNGDRFRRWVDHDIRLTRWNNDISSFKLS